MKGYQRLSAADRETLQQKYPAWDQNLFVVKRR